MKNQKVSTALGTIVLIIFSITVGFLTWKIISDRQPVGQPIIVAGKKNPVKKAPVAENMEQEGPQARQERTDLK